jgi:hypothetical protein
MAQTNHQTMIETTWSNPTGGCFNTGMPCVYYDISVIPSYCTDSAWKKDQCKGTGGATYNLPVSTSCAGTTTFTCQGPTNSTYGSELYPSNCGNPDATCNGNTATCVNAYFYPMFSGPPAQNQPIRACSSGNVLGITFLSGS